MRNRPEMELLRRIIHQEPRGAKLAIMVLACSKGAEVYSIMWTIRSARPDLKLHLTAIDISQEIMDFAKNGTYSLEQSTERLQPPITDDLTGRERLIWNTYREQGPLHNISLFERLSPNEIEAIFDINHDTATVKGWLKEDVTWAVGDAGDPNLVHRHGPQDIVVANRFLCHMEPQIAERCLWNIGTLVKPGGYVFVSGVDLEVREKVARHLGWEPVRELIQEIHEGDPSLTNGWPLGWWGVEPFSRNRRGWQYRYACVCQVPDTHGPASTNQTAG
jgi:chemotaxis methyl-accepting protein methylase